MLQQLAALNSTSVNLNKKIGKMESSCDNKIKTVEENIYVKLTEINKSWVTNHNRITLCEIRVETVAIACDDRFQSVRKTCTEKEQLKYQIGQVKSEL